MKDLAPTIVKFMSHYAAKAGASGVQAILEKRAVESDSEAQAVLDFLEVMYRRVAEDAERGVMVFPNQVVAIYDAEKVYSLVESWLEEQGYGHLISDD